MSAIAPSPFAFLLNSLPVWPFALWLAFTSRPGWSLPHRLLRPLLTPASSTKSRSPRIRYDTFPLTLAPCTPGCFGSSWALLPFAGLPLTQCLFTKFLSIKSRFCVQLPSHACSRSRSCLSLAVRRANARRSLSLPSYRPCRAYKKPSPSNDELGGKAWIGREETSGSDNLVWNSCRLDQGVNSFPLTAAHLLLCKLLPTSQRAHRLLFESAGQPAAMPVAPANDTSNKYECRSEAKKP